MPCRGRRGRDASTGGHWLIVTPVPKVEDHCVRRDTRIEARHWQHLVARVSDAQPLGAVALRLVQVNFKARNDSVLGRLWAEALGWVLSSEGPGVTNVEPPGCVLPDPAAVCIDVVTVPDLDSVKYRTHLALATTSLAHQAELVARLRTLGATSTDIGQGDVPWTVLADPEGSVFCVLEPRAIYADTGAIAAVVVSCADPGRWPRSGTRRWIGPSMR